MKKITSLILMLLLSQQASSKDAQLTAMTASGKYGSSEDFKASLDVLQGQTDSYSKREFARKGVFYSVRAGKKVLVGYLDAIPGAKSALGKVAKKFATKGMGGTWIDLGTDMAIDAADAATASGLRKQFNSGVNAALYDFWQKDKKKFKEVFSIQNHEQKTKAVYKALEDFNSFGEVLKSSNMDTDERAIFNTRAILSLSEITKNVTAQTLENEGEINKLKKDAEDFKAFMTKNGKDFKKYLKSKSEEEKRNVEVREAGERVGRSIASIKESPEEIVSRQYSDNLSSEEDAAFEEFKEATIEYVEKAQEYAQYMNASFQIAVNLGFDDPGTAKAVSYVNATVNVAGGIAQGMSGNPMGYFQAALTVTSLFGKPKPSPEQQRFEAIMKAFDQVFSNQRKILENQEKMYELQVDTYDLIVELYQLNQDHYLSINEDLQKILGNQAVLLDSVKAFSEIDRDLGNCGKFLNSRFRCNRTFTQVGGDLDGCYEQINQTDLNKRKYTTFFEPDAQPYNNVIMTGTFLNYDSMAKHFKSKRKYYGKCLRGIEDIFKDNAHAVIYAAAHVNEDLGQTEYESFIFPIYRPLLKFTKHFYGKNEQIYNSFYQSLTYPQQTYDFLSEKVINAFRYVKKSKKRRLSKQLIDKSLQKLIYVPALERYSSYLVELLPYRDIVDEDLVMESAEDIIAGLEDEASDEVIDLLYSSISLVNISIAQQSLISGESILHLVDRVMKTGNSHPMYYTALKMLKNNPILAKNYISYNLRNTFKYARKKGSGENSYAKVLSENIELYREFHENVASSCKHDGKKYSGCDGEFMKTVDTGFIFDRGTALFKDENGKDVRVTLPNADFIKKGMIEHSPYLFRLIVLRDKLYEMAYRNSGAAEIAIEDNFYAN